jgi:hypothetical protein
VFTTLYNGYEAGRNDYDQPESSFGVRLLNSALARRPGGPEGGFEVGAEAEQLTPYTGLQNPSGWGYGWRPNWLYMLVGTSPYIGSRKRPFINVVDWSFRFDAQAGYLELNHSWFCNDKNPSTPYVAFSLFPFFRGVFFVLFHSFKR